MMNASVAIRVWDLPTRLFHWLLVALVAFSWWSAETGEMDWHRLSGSALLGLVAFRILWGLFGSNTARFSSYLHPPHKVLDHLRSNNPGEQPAGHNPIGGYSVAAMLLLLTVQIGTGLFAVDVDGIESGQLSHLVDFDQGRQAAEFHHLSFTLLQVVVGLHILAILFYLVARKRNLVRPMVTGADPQVTEAIGALVPASPVRFLVSLILAVALGWWTASGFPM